MDLVGAALVRHLERVLLVVQTQVVVVGAALVRHLERVAQAVQAS